MNEQKISKGYVAIATVLVVGFIMLSSGMAVVLNSINEVQSSFSETQGENLVGFVESCVQDALVRLNKDNLIPATIVIPDGLCAVTINSQVGNVWDFTVSGTYQGYEKSVKVLVVRDSNVTVTSWLEI